MTLPSPIRFVLRHVGEGARRRSPCFYTMRIDGADRLLVPGHVVLVVRYGKVGSIGREVREPYKNPARAVERWGELAMRRRRHGYEEVTS